MLLFLDELERQQKHSQQEGAGRELSAKSAGPAVLAGPVTHIVMTEKDKYVRSTNRHFTVAVDDAKYHDIRREVFRWRVGLNRSVTLRPAGAGVKRTAGRWSCGPWTQRWSRRCSEG